MPEILGAAFAVTLMAFSYVVFSLSLQISKSPYFPLLADKIAKEIDSLPVTVVVAIVLFILKEVLEFFKKSRESKRKLFAYKYLIAEELELNLWTQRRLLQIIEDIEGREEEHPNAKYTLLVKESGNEYINGYDGDKLMFSCPIPAVHDKYYEKFVSSIAELDSNFFNLAQSSYEEVRNMAHVRSGLIKALMAEENDESFPLDIWSSGFLDYAKNELPDIYHAMNMLYKECRGKELKEFRLR